MIKTVYGHTRIFKNSRYSSKPGFHKTFGRYVTIKKSPRGETHINNPIMSKQKFFNLTVKFFAKFTIKILIDS